MPSLRELLAAPPRPAVTPRSPGEATATPQPVASPQGAPILRPDSPSSSSSPSPSPPRRSSPSEGGPDPRRLDTPSLDHEQLPMDWPPKGATFEEALWWQARHAFTKDLVIWIEPDTDHAWLAVRAPAGSIAPLVLLHRFPLTTNPRPHDPF
jgi:hypothetical protein